jgi:hypothetical protein
MGSVHNSLRSDMDASFSIFCHAQAAAPHAEGRSKAKHPDCDFRFSEQAMLKHFELRQSGAVFDVAFDLDFRMWRCHLCGAENG